MGGKTAIAAGLLLGVLSGAGALAAAIYLAPDVAAPVVSTPAPTTGPVSSPGAASPGAASASPSASAQPPSGLPSASPSAPSGAPPSPSAGPASGVSPSPAGSGPASSGTPSASPSSPAGLFHVGEPAPPLVVARLGGGKIDLSTLRGKPVWVNFMATWCLPCRDELPLMAGYAIRYQAQGLVVLTVDVAEDESTVGTFMRSLGVSFSTGLDLDGSAQAAWGAYALPVHFWVDANGIIRYGALGEIGPDVMSRGLQTIMPGVEVTP